MTILTAFVFTFEYWICREDNIMADIDIIGEGVTPKDAYEDACARLAESHPNIRPFSAFVEVAPKEWHFAL